MINAKIENTVSESELTDYVTNNAIKGLSIVQNAASKYQIVITLNWKEGEWTLITTRGKPREWASLDRLTRHFQDKYTGKLPIINLSI